MAEETAGFGTANDATVDTTRPAPAEDALAVAIRVVGAAEAKVEKQRAHLAGAEEALASAKAALASIQGA